MAAGSADAGDLGQGTAATERGISGANRGAACRFFGGNHRGGERCADAVLRIARSQGASFGVRGLPPERPCVDYKSGHGQEFGPRLINVLRSAPPRIHPAIPRLFRIGENPCFPCSDCEETRFAGGRGCPGLPKVAGRTEANLVEGKSADWKLAIGAELKRRSTVTNRALAGTMQPHPQKRLLPVTGRNTDSSSS